MGHDPPGQPQRPKQRGHPKVCNPPVTRQETEPPSFSASRQTTVDANLSFGARDF